MKYYMLHFGIALCLWSHAATAQGIITGTITDKENIPLADVNILIQRLAMNTSSQ